MQIVGVSNIKGGVGKTTTAVNLAFLAASAGRRELLEILAPTRFANLTLLPAHMSYRNFDVHMSAEKHPTRRGCARDPDAPLPGSVGSGPPGARNWLETPTAGGCGVAALL